MRNHTIAALTLGAMLLPATHSVFAHGKSKRTQHVTVNVTGSGYSPSTLHLKAGKPVHLTFVSKADSCANDILIPSLKKGFSLKPGQKKEIVFTPKKGQTIAFACSMNMFKGKATAK